MRPASSLPEVVELYDRYGADHYDEAISQRAHALQTAALARAAGATDALVVAALLHDVGHLLALQSGHDESTADLRHESQGAAYLGAVFGPAVTTPIALHVLAKRYRCATDPTEYGRLSEGSKASLAQQGGPLDPAAVARFERTAGFADAVALRGWDDAAKVAGLAVPDFDEYTSVLRRLRVTRNA